jgi:septum formation protein
MNKMKQINQEIIILASKSPRRKELLEQAGLRLEILPSDIDEKAIPLFIPEDFVKTLSLLKANSIYNTRQDAWVIGADTIVVVDGDILGKPGSQDEAAHMLNLLNNRSHSVFTGFTICCKARQKTISKSIETRVVFKHLSKQEINWYTAMDEPYDKAGAYGIQGIGSFMVREIAGSYSNVVGLPICEVMETLADLDIIRF